MARGTGLAAAALGLAAAFAAWQAFCCLKRKRRLSDPEAPQQQPAQRSERSPPMPPQPKTAVVGGPRAGGDAFDDGVCVEGERIFRILVRSGWWVDALEVVLRGPGEAERHTVRRGGSGGGLGILELDASEHVRAVEVWHGDEFVHGLRFATNRRQSGTYGRAAGERVLLEAPPGWELAGFHGRSGVFLDALGCHFRPLPGGPAPTSTPAPVAIPAPPPGPAPPPPAAGCVEVAAAVGSRAGAPFDDGELLVLPGARVVEACAHFDGEFVRSLELHVRTGFLLRTLPLRGEAAGRRAVLRAGRGEAVDGVDVWAGPAGVRALRLHCGPRSVLAGDAALAAQRHPDLAFRSGPALALVGFRGTADSRLRSLAVLAAPAPPAPTPPPRPLGPAAPPAPAFAPPPEPSEEAVAVTNWPAETEACGHSLPLLRGTCPARCTRVLVTVTFSPASGAPPEARAWPAAGGLFKALAPLRLGTNTVVVAAAEPKGAGVRPARLTLRHVPGRQLRSVRLVYVVARDGDGGFQAPPGEPADLQSARRRLALAGLLMQSFTAEKIFEHCLAASGPQRRTFELQEQVHIHRSGLTLAEARAMDGHTLHQRLGEELKSLPERDRTIDVAVMSFTLYDPARYGRMPAAHTALGGGHLALFGSSTLHTFAQSLDELVARFCDTRPIDTARFFDDSAGRGCHGANYSTGVGAMLHELGHCFGLSHTACGESIMARGFDRFSRTFVAEEPWSRLAALRWDDETTWHRASAALLFHHPFFRTDEMDREGRACRIGDGDCAVQCVDRLAGSGAELRTGSGFRAIDLEVDGNVVAHLEHDGGDEGGGGPPREVKLTPELVRSLLRLPPGAAAGVVLHAVDARGNLVAGRLDVPAPAR